jgi:type I restriction enzyme M protein
VRRAVAQEEIDLGAVNAELVSLEKKIEASTEKHNAFLKELGLPSLP